MFWGGIWALLLGSAFFWVPGLGPLLVAGPLVAWIVGALETAAVIQWKLQDYAARLASTPQELEAWLVSLADAGVDLFHRSQRKFWEPEFDGSDLNLAGWAKKLTGKSTITVGSIGLSGDFLAAYQGEDSIPCRLDELMRRFDRGDFDLVAVGRPVLADSSWPQKIRERRTTELVGFSKEALATLA